MNLLESFRVAWEAVKTNKMRSFLTMLGVVIGVSAVIAVIAIGQGGRAMIVDQPEHDLRGLPGQQGGQTGSYRGSEVRVKFRRIIRE